MNTHIDDAAAALFRPENLNPLRGPLCPACGTGAVAQTPGLHCESCGRPFQSSRECPICRFTAFQIGAGDLSCISCGVFDRRVWRPDDLALELPPDAELFLAGPIVGRLHRTALRMMKGLRAEGCMVIGCVVTPGSEPHSVLHLAEALVLGAFADHVCLIDSTDMPPWLFGERDWRPVLLPYDETKVA